MAVVDTSKKIVSCITVNTDASYHPMYKVGGFAFYIVCDHFKVQRGGSFNVQPDNAIHAETMCIGNALHYLLIHPSLPKTNLIIINSDCLPAFRRIKDKAEDKTGRIVYDILKKLRLATHIDGKKLSRFELRHVKAHRKIHNART